jgi:hypothetical protein
MPEFAAIHFAVRKELDKVQRFGEGQQPKAAVLTTTTTAQQQATLVSRVGFFYKCRVLGI